jgi:hypothetical protein
MAVLSTILASVTPAWASHVVLRPDGTGDVATFQAGADCVLGVTCDPAPDSLIVEAGVYDEDVRLDLTASDGAAIVCPAGPDATRLRSLTRGNGWDRAVTIAGLKIDGSVRVDESGAALQWSGCRFMGVTVSHSFVGRHVFADCEFRGRLDVAGAGSLDRCRFAGPGAALHLTQFALDVRDCVFESAADTALFATPGDQTFLALEGCSFRSVDRAIVVNPAPAYYRDGLRVTRCRFEDVTHEAISFQMLNTWGSNDIQFDIQRSRFSRCGAGIRLEGKGRIDLTMFADTLEDTQGIAVNAAGRLGWKLDSLVIRGGHAGAIALCETGAPIPSRWLTRSWIEDNAGDAVVLQGHDDPNLRNRVVAQNVIARNGGTGVRSEDGVSLLDNLVVGNSGRGLHLTSSQATHDSVVRNTVVGSGGAGVLIVAAQGSAPVAAIENNLSVENLGAGIARQGTVNGTARGNDAWRNRFADFEGVDPAMNLSADPYFCVPATLDYRVASNSPCAPGGTYGQIGAFGTGCEPQVVSVDPGPAAGVVIANVAPNPLVSGREVTVSFTLPRPASATMDVLDAGGRRVASRDLAESGAGSHRVKLRVDALPPGIYWLRVAQAGRSASSKISILP